VIKLEILNGKITLDYFSEPNIIIRIFVSERGEAKGSMRKTQSAFDGFQDGRES
jgi:hypothetical protein